MCVQGLWAQSMGFLLDFLVSNGFNAIRLPLCTQTCLSLDSTTTMPSGFDTSKNPTLVVSLQLSVNETSIKQKK